MQRFPYVTWAAALGSRWWTAVQRDHPELTPLELVASDACDHTLLGPVWRLIDLPSSSAPLRFVHPVDGQITADHVKVQIGKDVLDRFCSIVVSSPTWVDWNQLASIDLEAAELVAEEVEGWQLQSFLEQGRSRHTNSVVREFVTQGADLTIVVSTLRAHAITFSLRGRSEGLPSLESWRWREVLAPEIDVYASDSRVTLRSARPILIGVRCAEIDASGPSYSLVPADRGEPYSFRVRAWSGGVLPPLRRWRFDEPMEQAETVEPKRQYGEFVVLPDVGVRVTFDSAPQVAELFLQMHRQRGESAMEIPNYPQLRMWVLHSISELEPKRVRMLPESAAAVNALQLGFRLEPVLEYRFATMPSMQPVPITGAANAVVQLVCARTRAPIADTKVIAFVSWAQKTGATGHYRRKWTGGLADRHTPAAR